MRIDAVESKIGELHEYVRHIFTVFVNWFIFFVTVNYATMGWLTKPEAANSTPPQSNQDHTLLYIVVALFVSQNMLGFAACNTIYKYLAGANLQVISLENIASALDEVRNGESVYSSSVPIDTYKSLIYLAKWALVVIAVSWLAIGIAKKYH
ncbi:hypothetical protein [Paraburkholderia hospita]|uniref:hypothetical protein n=1 Tax=Paraburkholderia hospita TaxID=169430 RepID=UPI000271725A|nr:hypothetical protein [Paraburkholderia hospita]EUC12651.1 hypothetical protein PMI06_008406 [Burkholderia sp. BT03]SKC46803.1 hypothetical protein SAMN06266956_0128 [Paraburkholderia hospita]